VGRGEDLVAVLGQERLVGRHDMLAVGDGFQHQLARQRVAANQFDDDVDFRIAHQRVHVGIDQDRIADARARLGHVAHGGTGHLDAAAGAARDFFSVARQHRPGAAADHAKAQQAHLHGFHRGALCGRALRGIHFSSP